MKAIRVCGVHGSITRTATSLLTSILFLLLNSVPAIPQTETGQITVRAIDPQGAVVSGATVTVKSVDTSRTLPTQSTNDQGTATFPNLQPGIYEVSVSAGGFGTFTQRAEVTVGGRLTIEASLAAQAKSEVVNVVAGQGGVEVNTQNQELSSVVSIDQVRELPTVTRNPYDLVTISGNVTSDPQGATARGVGFAINGQRSASTNILLDGGENVDYFVAGIGQSVPLDSVQEFRIVTSSFSAEYGRASGGIVNVATKSGTNDFHGTLYEFNRVSALASNTFDNNANGLPKDVFTRNQFGFSVGGPILKEKLFFFNNTEWTRVRGTGNQNVLVPTPQLLAASAPETQTFFNAFQLRTPINGRVFTVGDITNALGLASGSPFTNLPAGLPAFGEVIFPVNTDVGGGFPQNSYQIVSRIDWNISDKTQLYGRYALESQDFFPGTNVFSAFQGFDTGLTNFNNNFLLSVTHTFTDHLVSQSKAVFNRLNNFQPLGAQPVTPTLYFFPQTGARIFGRFVNLPGYTPFSPGNAIPFGGPQNLFQLYEDVGWTHGNHQWRFGGQYVYIRDNRAFGAYQEAVEALGAQGDFDSALGNLVAGQLTSFAGAVNPQGKFPGQTIQLPVGPPDFTRSNRYHDFALYAEDSWRIRPRLLVNLGLRYEYFGVQHNKNPNLDSNFYLGSGANLFEQIRNGTVQLAEQSPVGSLWNPNKGNFAPRVGFAWDVHGDGKMSVRAGYGIGYERNFGNVTFNVIQNPPNYAVVSLISGVDVPSLPITLSNAGPLAGSSGTKILPPTSLRAVDQNIDTAYAQFWSASVQRQLTQNTIASVEYSGSAGGNLYDIADINRAGTGPFFLGSTSTNPATGAPSTRLNGQFSAINFRGSRGKSRYDGLTFSIDSSGWRNYGLRFTARYTYSVARDNLSSTFSESSNNFNLGYLDPFNPALDYGYADFDVRHRFVTSFNWSVPFWKNTDGVAGRVLGGWELTGIFTARTGTPFTVFDCTHALTTCARVEFNGPVSLNANGSPPPSGAPNQFQLIDLSGLTPISITDVNGFNETPPYPADMSGRNRFRSPGVWNLDFGLYKNFKITESKSLQLRSEFFNIFNHSNLYVDGANADLSSFSFVPGLRGVIPNGGTPILERRNVQLALKFIF
ncbi:MAG TPA: carboxypeptidase regulatory-like domain-containing protein [Blastocatellia bacterium]|nr:carboxypeptidase regulatory-like domain-containing protein [Blastocatellia bacterium]